MRLIGEKFGCSLFAAQEYTDERGFFYESWNQKELEQFGLADPFVQDNFSYSEHCFTMRGLHLQKAPHEQGKLVHVVCGAIVDVVVDLRPGSSNFGRHGVFHLNSDNRHVLWVPTGFAHGFMTIKKDTIVQYKCTEFYSPSSEVSLFWSDPALGIKWPTAEGVTLSVKDANAQNFETYLENNS